MLFRSYFYYRGTTLTIHLHTKVAHETQSCAQPAALRGKIADEHVRQGCYKSPCSTLPYWDGGIKLRSEDNLLAKNLDLVQKSELPKD